MRMSVTLDKELLEEARLLLGKKTKKEIIEEALKELVRKKRRDDAVKHAGKIDLDIGIEELIKMREDT